MTPDETPDAVCIGGMEAFDFYQAVLGGEYTSVSKFSDMAAEATPNVSHVPGDDGIMHISLPRA